MKLNIFLICSAIFLSGIIIGLSFSVSAQEMVEPYFNKNEPYVELKTLSVAEKLNQTENRKVDLELLVSKYAKLYDSCR